jgi:putative membrane protein
MSPEEPPGAPAPKRGARPDTDLSTSDDPAADAVPPAAPRLGPRRLHRAGIAVAALSSLREILIVVVVGIVLRAGSGGSSTSALLLAVGGAVVAVVMGYVRWMNEWYEVDGSALRHRQGVISPDETTIPLPRIQALDLTQGPVQRLLGVHELHVQTAGGGARGEIVLRALGDDDVDELRAAVGLPEPRAADLPEWRLSMGRLIVTALTAPQFGVVLPLVGGALAASDNLLVSAANPGLVDRVPTDAGGIALAVLAVAGVAWLISFAGAFVAFAGFSVVRDGELVRIRRGLLRRRVATVPLGRVHAVDVVEGALRRPFGLAGVRVEITGYREEGSAAQTLFPAVAVGEVDDLLARFVPRLAGVLGPLERPPGRARRRYVLPSLAAGLAAGGVATVAWQPAWPLLAVLGLIGLADGLSRYRLAGWRLSAGSIAVRQRLLSPGHRTLLARTARLQEHSLAQSPFQRRAQLANLSLRVGTGRTGRVEHLERVTAARLFELLRPR